MTLVLPRLADWIVIDLITERDEVWRTVVVHADGDTFTHREDLQGPMPPVPEESPMPLSRALRGVASNLAGPRTYQGPPDSGIAVEQRRLFDATGMHSAAIAPIRSTRAVLGALTLGRDENPAPFTPADLPLIEDIARRAGLALDNARLYQRQRKVAETMQNHLLPQMPGVPGLQMTVRYLPAPDASQVGGDWYDAFPGRRLHGPGHRRRRRPRPGGGGRHGAGPQHAPRLRLVPARTAQPDRRTARRGDPAHHRRRHGHDDLRPDRTGRRRPLATVLDQRRPPPPLLITHDGLAEYLTDGHGILLGTQTGTRRPDATTQLPPGSTLVLYTDGLIEAPRRTLDEGLDRLRQHAAALAHRPLASFTDQLLRRVRPAGNDDDVAVLALRVPGS